MKRFWRRMLVGGSSASEPVQTFVVECYWPRMMEEETWDILDRLLRVGREASPAQAVRSIGCILVPSDGMALFLFSAPSEDVVRRIGGLVEVPFDRIVESVLVGFGQQRRPER
jgi:hypothetical protein